MSMPTLIKGNTNLHGLEVTSAVISGDLKVKCTMCGVKYLSTIEMFADQKCNCNEGEAE